MGVVVSVEHNGKVYGGQIMKASRTSLGMHDHYGIMTANVDFEADHSGVSVGGFCLDEKPTGEDSWRPGTAYGLDHIKRFMWVFEAGWEKIPGREVIVIYDAKPGTTSFWGAKAIGISSLDGSRVFILEDHANRWLESEAARND